MCLNFKLADPELYYLFLKKSVSELASGRQGHCHHIGMLLCWDEKDKAPQEL
jgi:hypothetical protein